MGRPYDAIVLAGGTAERLGGADKAGIRVGGRTLLDRVLDVVADAERIVVVGDERPVDRAVHWTRERPPGGGPAAALGAGLAVTGSPRLVVLACDMPLLTRGTVRRLLAALDGAGRVPPPGAAMLVDTGGRRQMLAAAYRRDGLVAAFAGIGPAAGQSMRTLVSGLHAVEVAAVGNEALDCDTWVEVARSTRILTEEGT